MSRSGSPQAIDDFRIDEERPGSATILLTIHGDVDLRVAGELEDRLSSAIDEEPSALVVDLSGTTFLDSMALGVLLSGMKRLREQGGGFPVVAPGGDVRRIFEITLLDRIFELHDSRGEALAATRGGTGGALDR
jgi:anti-sigma B factor antagonist